MLGFVTVCTARAEISEDVLSRDLLIYISPFTSDSDFG